MIEGQMSIFDFLEPSEEEVKTEEKPVEIPAPIPEEEVIPESVVHQALNRQITVGDHAKIRKILEDNPNDKDSAPLIKNVYGCSGCSCGGKFGFIGMDSFMNKGFSINWIGKTGRHTTTLSWILVSEIIRKMIEQGIYKDDSSQEQVSTEPKPQAHIADAENPLLKFDLGECFSDEEYGKYMGHELKFDELEGYVNHRIIKGSHTNAGIIYSVVKLISFSKDAEKVYRNQDGKFFGEFLYDMSSKEEKSKAEFAGMASRIGYATGARENKANAWVSEIFCANGKYSDNVYQSAPPYSYYCIK